MNIINIHSCNIFEWFATFTYYSWDSFASLRIIFSYSVYFRGGWIPSYHNNYCYDYGFGWCFFYFNAFFLLFTAIERAREAKNLYTHTHIHTCTSANDISVRHVSELERFAERKKNRRVRNWFDSVVWELRVVRTQIQTQTASGLLQLLPLLFLFLNFFFALPFSFSFFILLTTTKFACARVFNDLRFILFPSSIFFHRMRRLSFQTLALSHFGCWLPAALTIQWVRRFGTNNNKNKIKSIGFFVVIFHFPLIFFSFSQPISVSSSLFRTRCERMTIQQPF